MYGLIDCNDFFVSCERLFRPRLNGKPVVVLSSNDGCVISRSNEAKALGVPMGIPLFKIKDEVKRYGVEVCSSNHTLYGDLSRRVMNIVRESVPDQEIYSIDECFIRLQSTDDYYTIARDLRRKILKGVGIPTCVGVSKTKTLAKLANRVAKKNQELNGVYAIDDNDKWLCALQWVDIGDVWGLGRRISERLHSYGVHTGYDFTCQDPHWVRQNFTVTGLDTYLELRGHDRIPFGTDEKRKSITRSCSFGSTIQDEHQLFSILLEFADKCCEKMRSECLAPLQVAVVLHTNRFSITDVQQHEYAEAHLMLPTNNLSQLIPELYGLFQKIYRQGVKYKKAGVVFSRLVNECEVLPFEVEGDKEYRRLAAVANALKSKYGDRSLYIAARDPKCVDHVVTRQYSSPRYTTELSEILQIHPK